MINILSWMALGSFITYCTIEILKSSKEIDNGMKEIYINELNKRKPIMGLKIYAFNEGPWANLSKTKCLHCYNNTVGYISDKNQQQIRRFCADFQCLNKSLKEIEEATGMKVSNEELTKWIDRDINKII